MLYTLSFLLISSVCLWPAVHTIFKYNFFYNKTSGKVYWNSTENNCCHIFDNHQINVFRTQVKSENHTVLLEEKPLKFTFPSLHVYHSDHEVLYSHKSSPLLYLYTCTSIYRRCCAQWPPVMQQIQQCVHSQQFTPQSCITWASNTMFLYWISQNHLALDNFISGNKLTDYFNVHIYSRTVSAFSLVEICIFYFKAIINPSAVSKYCQPTGKKQGATWHTAAHNRLHKPVQQQHCTSDQCHLTGMILLDSMTAWQRKSKVQWMRTAQGKAGRSQGTRIMKPLQPSCTFQCNKKLTIPLAWTQISMYCYHKKNHFLFLKHL